MSSVRTFGRPKNPPNSEKNAEKTVKMSKNWPFSHVWQIFWPPKCPQATHNTTTSVQVNIWLTSNDLLVLKSLQISSLRFKESNFKKI